MHYYYVQDLSTPLRFAQDDSVLRYLRSTHIGELQAHCWSFWRTLT